MIVVCPRFFVRKEGAMRNVTILKDDFKGHASKEEKAQRSDAKKELFNHAELKTTPPDYFNVTARNEWERIVPVLKKDLPLSEADYGMLVSYCLAFARIESAEREIRNKGVFFTRKNGSKATNPAVSMQSQAMKDLKAAATALGITMIERSRIALNNAKKEPLDPFAELMQYE